MHVLCNGDNLRGYYRCIHNEPVPRIYSWESDTLNHNSSTCLVSLILHARTPASQNWRSLSEEIKKTVARLHTSEMVALRFERAGSLYLTPLLPHFVVGPIISTPFYPALDGIVCIPDSADTCNLPNVDPNK
ncbi:hypothetical protein BD769DRAFT_1601522 [Suillus cothurnatus]|nr:hypothetical protein BD769DRAFT_1601522 [Suillus cothurnatus]